MKQLIQAKEESLCFSFGAASLCLLTQQIKKYTAQSCKAESAQNAGLRHW